jgi:ParB/Sulfiredoxin domain
VKAGSTGPPQWTGALHDFQILARLAADTSDHRRPANDVSITAGAAAMKFHPLADLFPLIEGKEFEELAADIRQHGLREPVILYQDQILDGRNRFRACHDAGVECRFENYKGDDPAAYVVSLNLKRRHLSESQRAMVAAKLATLPLGANQHSEGLPIGRASELLSVGERTVARAKEVVGLGRRIAGLTPVGPLPPSQRGASCPSVRARCHMNRIKMAPMIAATKVRMKPNTGMFKILASTPATKAPAMPTRILVKML